MTRQLKAVRLTLKAPARPDRTLLEVSVTALLAEEIKPPPGEPSLQWLLLTNLPVENAGQALICTEPTDVCAEGTSLRRP